MNTVVMEVGGNKIPGRGNIISKNTTVKKNRDFMGNMSNTIWWG